jgi:hypothetical protein
VNRKLLQYFENDAAAAAAAAMFRSLDTMRVFTVASRKSSATLSFPSVVEGPQKPI